MAYFKFQADVHGEHGIAEYPVVPDDVSFVAGRVITRPLPHLLRFIVSHPATHPPGHLLGSMIPVASRPLLDSLIQAGVNNIQTFPAVLRNQDTGEEWANYFAMNIVGLVDGADMASSVYDTVMEGDGLPPLVDFTDLSLADAKVGVHLLFRVVQSPIDMFMADSVRSRLIAARPAGGWGVTTTEVKSTPPTRQVPDPDVRRTRQ
ncbi:hypothetical protein L6R50_15425 [Myxococcota bacterium]|nr:hypothetical protein [Myxococcota bacterium]